MTRLITCFTLGVVAIVALSCRPAARSTGIDSTPQATIGAAADYRLRLGETIRLHHPNVRVRLDSLSESRCPTGVVCAVAGIVALSLTIENADHRVPFTLTLMGDEAFNEFNAPTVELLGHSFRVRRLDPYPVYGTTPSDSNYLLILIAR